MYAEACEKVKFSISLKSSSVFQRLYSKGKNAVSHLLVIYCRKTKRSTSRVGITVSKKLGKAVVRNKIRRRIREIYRTNEDKFLPGFDIVVVARKESPSASYRDLEKQFLYLADKLGMMKPGDSQ